MVVAGLAAAAVLVSLYPQELAIWWQRNVLLRDVDWPRATQLEVLGVRGDAIRLVRGAPLVIKFVEGTHGLGVLLAEQDRFDEAELRFTQVVSISRDHVEALVSLALCHQRRLEAGQAIPYIRRAQALRPGDAKIALLLAQAAKLAHEQGEGIDICAVVTDDNDEAILDSCG